MSDVEILNVQFDADTFTFLLKDGRKVTAPLWWYPKLYRASPRQRFNWKLLPFRDGVEWEELDEHVSAKALILGLKDPKAIEPETYRLDISAQELLEVIILSASKKGDLHLSQTQRDARHQLWFYFAELLLGNRDNNLWIDIAETLEEFQVSSEDFRSIFWEEFYLNATRYVGARVLRGIHPGGRNAFWNDDDSWKPPLMLRDEEYSLALWKELQEVSDSLRKVG